MSQDLSGSSIALSSARRKQVESERLERAARRAAWAARVFAVLAAFTVAVALLSLRDPRSAPSTVESIADPQTAARAREVQALQQSGEGIAMMIVSGSSLLFFALTARFSRKWAVSASEAVARSDTENRGLLEAVRSSREPFALYLRGFEEESKSFRSLLALPLSTKRVDKATRWVESEIVDELEQRGRKVFCIANPSDRFLLPGAFRVTADGGAWIQEVGLLADECELVVIHISGLSPGLTAELDLLRQQNNGHKSIVVGSRRLLRRNASTTDGFLATIITPPRSIFNLSAFGPIMGRRRFQRELSDCIEKAVEGVAARPGNACAKSAGAEQRQASV